MAKKVGLLIERETRYSTERITVRVVVREDGADHPVNANCFDSEHGTALDHLQMSGFVSDVDASHIGFEPHYYQVHSVNLGDADRMAKMLRKIVAAQRKANAYEAGDLFMVFAKAIKAEFVVTMCGASRGSSYAENDWYFTTVCDGRNTYRRLIETACDEMRQRKAA